MEMLWTAAKLHWIFLVRIGCALCVFSITRAKMKSVQRQQQPAKESSISNAVIGSKRGPHTWNRHLFFSSSELLTTYKFSSRFNWYKKFGHNGMQWALKMWTNFSKEKTVFCCEGSEWGDFDAKINENCVSKQYNVPSLLLGRKILFQVEYHIKCWKVAFYISDFNDLILQWELMIFSSQHSFWNSALSNFLKQPWSKRWYAH